MNSDLAGMISQIADQGLWKFRSNTYQYTHKIKTAIRRAAVFIYWILTSQHYISRGGSGRVKYLPS